MIYVNLVGGQDELIFDGNSFIISVEKKSNLPCYYLKNFEPDNFSFFLEKLKEIKQKQIKKNKNQVLFNSLCLGLSDFVLKNGFSKVHLGLSGGIDSALVLAIAVESLGKNNVSAIAMPGPFNAPESLLLAEKMCLGLDVNFYKIPIETSYELINQNYQKCVEKMAFGIVQENIQARLRGLYLMAFSNNKNSLLLNTSNKTELATGYSTLYGDLCGGMSPIGDLLKTEVIEISKWLNRDKEVIPKRIIDRPPSAELRPNQKDEDSLLAYSKLDKIVEKLICKKKSPRTQEEFTVARMVANSQFKRWQAPPILRVSEHAFGIGRRIPITNAFKH
jgi:NAD+ synthase (glutamine-hydrolysing)